MYVSIMIIFYVDGHHFAFLYDKSFFAIRKRAALSASM